MRISPASTLYLVLHFVVFVIGGVLVFAGSFTDPTRIGAVLCGSIGASMIAAALTGWVVYVYVHHSETLATALNSFVRFGLVAAFSRRSITIREEYDDRMRRFSRQADILGFGLNSLRQDHAHSFGRWKQQGQIRVLLLDPEFPSPVDSYANQRDKEEKDDPGTIARQIRQFVRDTKEHVDDRFQIRLYRCLPVLNIFRIDGDILWGPYLMFEPSRNAPTFVVREGGEMYDRLVEHFERIWTSPDLSRPVPAEWMHD